MPIAILSVAVVALALLERSRRWRRYPQRMLREGAGTDVIYLLTGYVAGASLALAYVGAAAGLIERRAGVPRLAALGWPLWAEVVVALIAIDAGNYLVHWLLHRVGPLWELHKVHHSSRQLDWLAAFRSHLLEQLLRRLLAPLLLIAGGAPLDAVAVAGGLFSAWAALNHANLRLGPRWMESVLVTPRLHRLHHVPATSEHNLGTLLTLWDRLRGTLVTGDAGGATLGVPGERDDYPQGWWRQLWAPLLRRA